MEVFTDLMTEWSVSINVTALLPVFTLMTLTGSMPEELVESPRSLFSLILLPSSAKSLVGDVWAAPGFKFIPVQKERT